jgi:polyhydroxybutyrate depolymerase
MKINQPSAIGLMAVLLFAPLTVFAANPSEGCDPTGWKSGTYTMEHSGITRTFRVHVPKGYRNNVPAPLVTYFHGWGGNENEILGNKRVTSQADRRGYILVAPRGLGSGNPDQSNNSWSFSGSTDGLAGDDGAICDDSITPDYSYSSCEGVLENTCSWTHCQADDVDFVAALVETIGQNLCVDTNNVFASGGSNGGMFTWELGQNPQSAEIFRAIAPIIGLPHKGYLEAQGRVSDMPALVITGTRDNVVPPGDWEDESFTTTSNGNDRYYYTGATAITQSWAEAHSCDTTKPAKSFNDGVRKTDCRTYCSGDPGWPRVLDCRARMGHTYSLSWSWQLVMDFFDAHSDQ